ncbi:TonB-dependent receptor domain-containing protein [Corallibacter sp.]|uniref:TonB-dependent receptor domain-containing protein n=1 Tax=Corallibacter sp. TaxID=2038084 RepID=UPI003AB1DA97
MKFNISIFCFLLTAIPMVGVCQEISISGTVKTEENIPVSFANAVLLSESDSTVVSGASTNDQGYFIIDNIEEGDYKLKITFIGYNDYTKSLAELTKHIDLGTIVLQENSETLSEVSITAKKPTVKKEADRLVFNVAETALSEGSLLDVVKSTPGVLVFDGKILIKNTVPTVYINDRKAQLTSSELLQLLESSPANTIQSIEVITNPPANYDAESGAVLNIKMTKNLATGYRGSVYGNYTQGVFPRYNGGLNQYFKTNKINVFANYSYTHNKINRENDDTVFYLDQNNEIDEAWQSNIKRNTWTKTHNVNFNIDVFFNEKNKMNVSSNILLTPYFKYNVNNNTNIYDENNLFLSRFDTQSTFKDKKHNLDFDLGYTHTFNEGSGSLYYNGHFTTYKYDRTQEALSQYYDQNNVFINPTAFDTDANQRTNIFTSQIDYNLPLKNSGSLDLGVKFSNVKTESDIEKNDFDFNTNQTVFNYTYSNAFNYDESVFAAYANFNKDWTKWSLNAGLRVEQTDIEGESLTTNQTNTQSYFEWFPSVSLKFQASDNFSVYTNYKRSITRPDFKDLNPFTFFLNDNTFVVGNPNLKPVFTDHYTFGTNITEYFTFEAYYKRSQGNIYQLARQNNATNQITYSPININETREYGFDFVTYFNVTPSWFLYAVTSFYNIQDQTQFGQELVTLDEWSNYSVLNNTFSFLKDKSLSVNAAITYLSSYLYGFSVVEDRFLSDLSVTKSVFNSRGVLSLSISDALNKADFKTSTQYDNQYSHYNTDQDTRYIKLGFRYKFGNIKLQTNERHKSIQEVDRIKDLD